MQQEPLLDIDTREEQTDAHIDLEEEVDDVKEFQEEEIDDEDDLSGTNSGQNCDSAEFNNSDKVSKFF